MVRGKVEVAISDWDLGRGEIEARTEPFYAGHGVFRREGDHGMPLAGSRSRGEN